MACLQNVRIKQTVTYDSTPDLVNGLVQGQVAVEIFNTYGYPISGEVIVDRVRDLPVVNLEDASISETQYITSTGDTFNYNFYYPSTQPINVVINVKVKIRVEDCFYEHTCSHVLLTPNPNEDFSYCDVFVQGYEVISGCTNPLYYEFNPNANFDDGSCALLKPVYGCTNPLAVNYNPNADYNDGTCIFASGCTNPIAVNYNPIAVIDDGTCECGDINVQLNFNQLSGESFIIEPNCQYLFEFDWFVQIDCGKLIEYLQNDTRTILEVLGDLAINAQAFVLTDEEGLILDYTGGTISYTGDTTYLLAQNENLYTFDSEVVPYGIGTTGSEEDCAFVNELISTELGIDCPPKEVLENRFKGSWTRSTFILNSDLVGSFTKFNLNFANFNFGACVHLDNVKVSKLCSTPQNRCVIIPSQYGLEFDKVIDNKKAWLYSEELTNRTYDFVNQETDYQDFDSRLILNTKELELTINPVKYIESDVLSYYEYYQKFFVSVDERYTNLSKDYITYEAINPIGRQFIRQYPFLNTIYEQYLDGLDCAPTKALDYPYGIEIINRTGDYWYSAVKQLLPATTIWNEAQYTYKNNIFHKPKHTYKKYTLGGESDTEVLQCTTNIVSPTESNFLSVIYWSTEEVIGGVLLSAEFTSVTGGTIVTVNPTDKDIIPDGALFAADLQIWLDANGGGTVTWLTPTQSIPNVFVPTISGYYMVVQSNTQYLTTVYYEAGGEPIANDANISCTNSYTIEPDYQYITSFKINGTEIVPINTLWDMSTSEGVIAAGIAINNAIVGTAYAITDIYYLFISLPNCEEIILTTINECPSNVPTISCRVLSDKCLSEPFDNIDNFLSFNFGNVQCTSIFTGGTIGYSGSGGEGNFTGKIIQYSTNENGENNIENYFGFNDYNCITGEPIPNCDGVIISANLSYLCLQNDSGNTGFADVTLSVSGGQAPYIITGYYSGTILTEGGSVTFGAEHDDVVIISVEDANGCTSTNNFIEIDCPIPLDNCIPVVCEGNTPFELEVKLSNYTSSLDVYTLEVNLTSPTYTGSLMGSYKISNLAIDSILIGNERYRSGADYTPNVELSNYLEFGFNQLTPNGDATTVTASDSPWYLFLIPGGFGTDNPNFIVGNNITIDIALFDENYCLHKTSVSLTIPTDGNINTVTTLTPF